jgi:putative MATE family efflux protein
MSDNPSWNGKDESPHRTPTDPIVVLEDSGLGGGARHIKGARDLTTGPIFKTLMIFTLPTLASNILHTLNGSISALWVSHYLGDAALAATANANIIMFLMFSVIFGFGMTANVLVGQAFGRGDLDSARRAFGTAIGFCLGITFLIAIAGFMWSDHILAMLSTPPEVFRFARIYLNVTFFGLPAGMMFIMLMSGLRGGGDATTPFWFILLSLTLAATLNPVFILGLGPAPAMGIAGSAFATAIASYLSLTAMILYIYKRDLPLRLRGSEWHYLKPDMGLLRIIVGRGVPMGVQMVVMSLSTLVIFGFVNREGTLTVAAFAAATQLWNYLQMPAMAVGGAVTATAAQNIGAGKWNRVEQTTRAGMILHIGMTGAMIALITLFDRSILGLFLESGGEAVQVGAEMMHIINWSYLIFGMTMVMFGTMRANGVVIGPLIILTLALFGVRIGFYLLSYPYMGVDGLWWSFPVSSTFALLLGWLYYRYGRWREVSMSVPRTATLPARG